jgi:hypothetical protein
VPEKLIPSTFEEETNFQNAENMILIKCLNMTCDWQLRRYFLNYLEDFMTQDSLFGSTNSTISKKNISCVSKISSPSVLSEDTEASKTSG